MCTCRRHWLGRQLSITIRLPGFECGQKVRERSCLKNKANSLRIIRHNHSAPKSRFHFSFIENKCIHIRALIIRTMQSGSSIAVKRERYQFTIKNPRDIWSRSASSLAAKCLVTAVTDGPVFRWRFHDWGRRWLAIRKHIPKNREMR